MTLTAALVTVDIFPWKNVVGPNADLTSDITPGFSQIQDLIPEHIEIR
ncbi:hypothetical protein [uncultured Amphritea sp.]|nr:hypothetical protein [uncultured Amphritea sp.]